ncbi:uncharacterized protein BP5553_02812 [Venustampulla echinocandica]|uniref:Uncharacterized protein n=1 Tax=Venustampulla echinocandica TaxID=2656787 RepID=A0A370TSG9_9HELO|nr:uncharacterized protein BP5553_02812 [Venustampulla echinocandica]RDL38472.1 hypothetical protein BP5553_02812 [Venustampulla echinocandica]
MSLQVGPIDLSRAKDHLYTETIEPRLFDILAAVLEPNSHTTPAVAVGQINNLLYDSQDGNLLYDAQDSRVSVTDAEASGLAQRLWLVLIQVVQLIPHDHEGQDKLVELLHSLTQLPPITRKFWGTRYYLWTDLPLLGQTLRDWWIGPDYDNDTIPKARVAFHWLNFNSFAARVLNADLAGWTNFAEWEVCQALERPPPLPEKWVIDCDIAVAAEWILRGGEGLFKRLSKEELGKDKDEFKEELSENKAELSEHKAKLIENKAELGENKEKLGEDEEKLNEYKARSLIAWVPYSGRPGFNRERWAYWKKRFGEIAEEADGSVLEWSAQAAAKMGEIDGQGSGKL